MQSCSWPVLSQVVLLAFEFLITTNYKSSTYMHLKWQSGFKNNVFQFDLNPSLWSTAFVLIHLFAYYSSPLSVFSLLIKSCNKVLFLHNEAYEPSNVLLSWVYFVSMEVAGNCLDWPINHNSQQLLICSIFGAIRTGNRLDWLNKQP